MQTKQKMNPTMQNNNIKQQKIIHWQTQACKQIKICKCTVCRNNDRNDNDILDDENDVSIRCQYYSLWEHLNCLLVFFILNIFPLNSLYKQILKSWMMDHSHKKTVFSGWTFLVGSMDWVSWSAFYCLLPFSDLALLGFQLFFTFFQTTHPSSRVIFCLPSRPHFISISPQTFFLFLSHHKLQRLSPSTSRPCLNLHTSRTFYFISKSHHDYFSTKL